MKKIISIILGIMLMFAMSVTSFAAKAPAVDPETITVSVVCSDADHTVDPLGNPSNDMIYEFTTTISNDTKKNINMNEFTIALILINDKTYDTVGSINLSLADKWINAQYDKDPTTPAPAEKTTNTVRVSYDEPTSVDIKAYINSELAEGMITSVKEGEITITFDVTPKAATPDAPTQAPTEAPTEAPTQAPTEAPTNAPTQAPTEAPEVTNPVEDDYVAPPVDDTIPDTGATVPFAAIGTLVTSAITALVAKKKKEN